MTFRLDDYTNLPRAVRFAYRRKEQECQRYEAEIEWLRAKMVEMEKDIATLRNTVENTGNLVPLAYREALEKAARIAPPEYAEQIRSTPCPYR